MTHPTPTAVDWHPLAALGRLLTYPDGDFAPRAAACREQLASRGEARLLGIVAAALELLALRPAHELEELYTHTFDLNPVCTLEVGWHLYGEQYERGRFLVRARQMLAAVGQDEAGELPDFLPSLLGALARQPEDDATDLAAYLLPAVSKMCEALDKKDRDNPYHAVLVAIRQGLTARVPEDAVETVESRYRPHVQAPKRDLVQLGSSGRGAVDRSAASGGRR